MWGLCFLESCKEKKKRRGKNKGLELKMVVSTSLSALSTCTAHLALTQRCCCLNELSLEDRDMAKPIL